MIEDHLCLTPKPVVQTRSLSLGAFDIWARLLFVVGAVLCGMLSSISGLSRPTASNSSLPSFDDQKCLQAFPDASWGDKALH